MRDYTFIFALSSYFSACHDC